MEVQFNQPNINSLQPVQINNLINTLDKDVEKGKWKGKDEQLSDYIDQLVIGILIHSPSLKEFPSLPKIQKILKFQTGNHFKITKTIIDKCLSHEKGVKIPIHELTEITKTLPTENINNSLEIINKLKIDQNEKNQVIAGWIDYHHIPISKLNLSHENLKSILPHLTHLKFDLGKVKESALNEYLSICKNLKFLILSNDEIEHLSINIDNLKELEIFSDSLKEIKSFNKGLERLMCSCQNLDTMPADLPKTLETLTFLDCEKLEHLPKLNEHLKKFQSLNCPEMILPGKIEAHLSSFEVVRHPLQRLPILPEGVTSITCSECLNLVEITSLPKTVTSLDVRNCENLESILGMSKNIKNFYSDGCQKLQLSNK